MEVNPLETAALRQRKVQPINALMEESLLQICLKLVVKKK